MKLTLSHNDIVAGICAFLGTKGLTGFDPSKVHAEFSKSRADGTFSVTLDDDPAALVASAKEPAPKESKAKPVAEAPAAKAAAQEPQTAAPAESQAAEPAEQAAEGGGAAEANAEEASAGSDENLFG